MMVAVAALAATPIAFAQSVQSTQATPQQDAQQTGSVATGSATASSEQQQAQAPTVADATAVPTTSATPETPVVVASPATPAVAATSDPEAMGTPPTDAHDANNQATTAKDKTGNRSKIAKKKAASTP